MFGGRAGKWRHELEPPAASDDCIDAASLTVAANMTIEQDEQVDVGVAANEESNTLFINSPFNSYQRLLNSLNVNLNNHISADSQSANADGNAANIRVRQL